MIEQLDELAPDKRLKLLTMEKRRISSFANPLGPMHDSRQGLAPQI
jgi:hypothetical protein